MVKLVVRPLGHSGFDSDHAKETIYATQANTLLPAKFINIVMFVHQLIKVGRGDGVWWEYLFICESGDTWVLSV